MADLETIRTFIAIPLTPELTNELDALQRTLKRTTPDGCVRWVPPTNIHLTLHFLGDILLERVDPVREALGVVARNVPPFEFTAGELGAFPNLRRPRVIWVGVQDPTSWLGLLHATVNEALAKLGFKPETRRFSPHLTLGRVRRRAESRDVRALGETIAGMEVGTLGRVPVRELIFFKSELKPTGAEYTRLDTFELKEPTLTQEG